MLGHKLRSLWLFSFLFVILIVPFALAHGAGGYEVEENGYLIDVGFDPSPLLIGYPSSLSIGIANASTKKAVDIEKIWVRLSTEQGVVYAANHFPENGFSQSSLIFPRKGNYTLSVRFFEEGKIRSIASADFPLKVEGSSGQGAGSLTDGWGIVFLLSGMAVAGIIGYIIGVARNVGKGLNRKKDK